MRNKMQNKLQELTDKLYNEGLAKGKQEGEEMIAKAKQVASSIVAKANGEAKAIIDQAKREAEEIKAKVKSDIKMSSVQTISSIKQQIEKSIITTAISEPIKMALDDKSFIQDIISEAVKSFDAKSASAVSLDVLLPDSKKNDLEVFIKNAISKLFGAGFDVKFDKNLKSGFKIGPKDGSYFLSFTDKDFEALFSEYLRPTTRKLLFGK